MKRFTPTVHEDFTIKRKYTHEQKCPKCGHLMHKDGRTPTGRQRFECHDCGKKTSVPARVSGGNLGELLKSLRETRGMTQEFVSGKLGHSRGWLSRIETGEREIGIGELFLLAEIYQMRASDILLEYERAMYPNR